MKEIRIQDIPGICIGQVENAEAATGCTVVIAPEGMCAGLDVRGGGPASRETELLKPMANAKTIHSIVLSGGSAFGLDAAGGVMQYLEEQNIGYPVGVTKVPLVCQSDLFDLSVGDTFTRPDKAMGYAAAKIAMEGGNYRDGNFGAGCGASVGKMLGMECAMKAGIGSYAVQIGDLMIGALVAVNALGDIYDYRSGQKVAGVRNPEDNSFISSDDLMVARIKASKEVFVENTTIGIIFTNAAFDKTALCKIAGMGHDGYARSISPVHTTADGDSIYAVSVGSVSAYQDMVGALAANVMSEAILRAVDSAESAYGLIARKDLLTK